MESVTYTSDDALFYRARAPLFSMLAGWQEVLKVVNALLTAYDQNGAKQREGLEECVLAFKNAIEGDLDTRLDTLAEVCFVTSRVNCRLKAGLFSSPALVSEVYLTVLNQNAPHPMEVGAVSHTFEILSASWQALLCQ